MKTRTNSRPLVLLRCILAAVLLALLSPSGTPAQSSEELIKNQAPQGLTESEITRYIAPTMLRSIAGKQDGDSILSRAALFLLLGMPEHALQELNGRGKAQNALEAAMLEAWAARARSEANVERMRLLAKYQVPAAAASSNRLYEVHLRSLDIVGRGVLVTNSPIGRSPDFRPLGAPIGKPKVVLILSSKCIASACSRGDIQLLADQVALAELLSKQPVWNLVIDVTESSTGDGYAVRVLGADGPGFHSEVACKPLGSERSAEGESKRQMDHESMVLTVLSSLRQ